MSVARRVVVGVVVVACVAGGLVFGVRAAWRALVGPAGPQCTFGAFHTDTDQASVAARMTSVVIRRKLPERAAVLVLEAALQESKLRNIPAGQGDRDSVGVLQQRPSQGWGSNAQLSDPEFATGAFLDRLVKTHGWRTGESAKVIQSIQVSADGSLYAKHEPQAQAMADALTGKVHRGIRCSFDAATVVADGDIVSSQVVADLAVHKPTVTGARINVVGQSWTTAAWFVANADRLGIDEVQCDGAQWRRGKDWRTYAQASTTDVVAVLHT